MMEIYTTKELPGVALRGISVKDMAEAEKIAQGCARAWYLERGKFRFLYVLESEWVKRLAPAAPPVSPTAGHPPQMNTFGEGKAEEIYVASGHEADG